MKADVSLPQQIASKVILHLHGQHALQSDVDEVAEIVAREIEQSELVVSLRKIDALRHCTKFKSQISDVVAEPDADGFSPMPAGMHSGLRHAANIASEALATIGGDDAN